MRYLFLIALVLGFIWLADLNPLTHSTSVYFARCHQPSPPERCMDEQSSGPTLEFRTSLIRQAVMRVEEGKIPEEIGQCEVHDRLNWSCRAPAGHGIPMTLIREMKEGHYSFFMEETERRPDEEIDGVTTDHRQITRATWVALRLREGLFDLPGLAEKKFNSLVDSLLEKKMESAGLLSHKARP